MKRIDENMITDELMAAFLDGNTSPEETMLVINALSGNPQLRELLVTSERVDEIMENNVSELSILPMNSVAAKTEDNLCDLQCEEYILRKNNIVFDAKQLSKDARENRWLKENGTPLYNIGRLLEKSNLSVQRHYNSSIEELNIASRDNNIIVVVSGELLYGFEKSDECGDVSQYHAVVFLNYNKDGKTVLVFDPVTGNDEEYPVEVFLSAWQCSHCYMVTARKKTTIPVYNPQPIDIEDVELTEELLDLREAIAENAHDVWAIGRIREGWTYGPERNDAKKQNPDLVPYSELIDSEKQYDRDVAMNTIKLLKKLGYDIIKNRNSSSYKILRNRLLYFDNEYCCKECGSPIFKDQLYCERCGRKLSAKDYQ